MKYGVIIIGGPVDEQIETARAAEAAGWYDPQLIGEMRDWIAARRGSADGFDIVLEGPLDPGEEDDIMRAFEAAGATWWIHSDWEASDPSVLRRRIEAGPPRSAGG